MNDFEWLDRYLLSLPGVTKDFKVEWQWWRYMVGEKMFAAILHPSKKYNAMYAEKDLITLKCEPMQAELYRKQYPEIMPGFYADKRCYNSIDLRGELTKEFIKHMCRQSYDLIFSKLTKKMQAQILQLARSEDNEKGESK